MITVCGVGVWADAVDPQWEYVISAEGVDGVTFFDLTGSSMWSSVPERTLLHMDEPVRSKNVTPSTPGW
ncbi:hypothetical protein MAHJHV60_45570 [Mycobacterium avium subsp. hominissuis]